MTTVYLHASELYTGEGLPAADGRRPREEHLGRVEDGALVVGARGKVIWAGKTARLPRDFRRARKIHDLERRQAVIPGLVDCHTHLVFAGNRADEFAARCGGATYEEIAARGGGISATVRATRAATGAELERLAVARVQEALRFGVRTLEVKSGYGLDLKTELKCLEVVQRLRKRFPEVVFQATFLGAHAFPTGVTREHYWHELLEKMLPAVKEKGLAEACDIFIDRGYYTREEGRALLQKAKSLGFAVKVHADELSNTDSAALAAELGALSADHLLRISAKGIRALAQSQTTAVLLPGTAFYLNVAHAPARKLIDAGARVAIATDFNPGTCMTLNLPAVLTIAALNLRMTRAELFAAVTYNAACALGLQEQRGTLRAGTQGAPVVLPFERFEELYYRFAAAGFGSR